MEVRTYGTGSSIGLVEVSGRRLQQKMTGTTRDTAVVTGWSELNKKITS